MGQIFYVDEMFIIKCEIGGGSPSVLPFISSVVQIPDLDWLVGDPWGKKIYLNGLFIKCFVVGGGSPSLKSLAILGLDPHLNRYLGDPRGK